MTRDEAAAITQEKMWELVPNLRTIGFSNPAIIAHSLVDVLEALGVLKLDAPAALTSQNNTDQK